MILLYNYIQSNTEQIKINLKHTHTMSCCKMPQVVSKLSQPIWSLKPIPLNTQQPVPSDIDIAGSITGKPISQLCQEINVKEYDPYGKYKAKVTQTITKSNDVTALGNYVVVTGITPTSFGEGKSTTTIGLVQGLTAHLGKNSFACIRQPSQGPTFGMKGGAAGGGYSQVWPMDEFNMHLTGDIHAVTAANNLVAAAIDARMFHESTQNDTDLFRRLVDKPGSNGLPSFTEAQKNRLERLGISNALQPTELSEEQKRLFARLDLDPDTITWTRVIDTNDRYLRKITIGQSPTEKGKTRETKFAISVVSEIMAILALASDFDDVCKRVARIVVGFSKEDENKKRRPVTCEDLCVDGAVCALLKDSIHPTIMQTLEGTPLLVHCGPFANIAHGNSSIIADKLALELVGPDGFVVTEAGFASDVGFEKFIDIKCKYSNLMPNCAVLVSTIRALKMHGRDLLQDKTADDKVALDNGLINMNAHIRNINENFHVPVVVALNKFKGDTPEELEYVKKKAIEAGASDCRVADNWAHGGKGAIDLANGVIEVCKKQRESKAKGNFLYDAEKLSILEKINTITSKVYGATAVKMSDEVLKKIELLESNGFGSLPLCIAKTHLSISHDPKMKGAPSNYTFPIVDINVSAGAGFLYALAGEISTMPGLPTRPAFFDISIDTKTGQIKGLF